MNANDKKDLHIEKLKQDLFAAREKLAARDKELSSIRSLLAAQDINIFGSNGDGEIEWPLRDEVIDGITKVLTDTLPPKPEGE